MEKLAVDSRGRIATSPKKIIQEHKFEPEKIELKEKKY